MRVAGTRPSRIDFRWIDAQGDLDDIVATLADCDRYALDTEFHRERTYYPKLALARSWP